MRLCSVTQVMSDSATPWTVARHAPRPMGFSPGKNTGELPFLPPRGSSQPGYWTHVSCVSCIGSHILYHWATWEAHGFVLNSFYYLEICSFYAHFGKSFFYHECWVMADAFSAFSEMIMWLLSSVYVLYHIDLPMLNHPCEPRMNPTWLWYTIFSMCFWIWFANILLRIFASIFIKSIGL